MDPTAAAYQGLPQVDKAFYDKVRESKSRKLVQDFTIPIRTGQAWKVPQIPFYLVSHALDLALFLWSMLMIDSRWEHLSHFNC